MITEKDYGPLFVDKIYGDLLVCGNKNKLKENNLEIVIDVIKKCNYKCDYCAATYSPYPARDGHELDLNNLVIPMIRSKVFNDIFNKNKTHNKIIFFITGGEPTLYKKLESMLKLLENVYSADEIVLLTNGSKSVNFYLDLLNKFKTLKIRCSYHAKFADNQHFYDLINLKDDRFEFLVMMDELHKNKIVDFIENIKYDKNFIYRALINYVYTDEEMIKYINKHTEHNDFFLQFEKKTIELNKNSFNLLRTFDHLNIFKDMYCDVIRQCWAIGADSLQMCAVGDYRLCCDDDMNRFEEDYNKYYNGFKCNSDYCKFFSISGVIRHKYKEFECEYTD